jgi:hypothetical protein
MLFTVITTLPVVAVEGALATTVVLAQLVTVAATPLNVIVLEPWEAPNPLPAMVTVVPATPDAGERFVMLGVTVKNEVLLAAPLTVTTTGDDPGPSPAGTLTAMLVLFQFAGAAVIPAKVMVLEPWEEPKFVPVMVIAVPAGPEISERLVITGVTTKIAVLLTRPFTVTETTVLPGARLGTNTLRLLLVQLEGVTATPPKLTVLVPWLEPKLLPAIVTELPTGPDDGVRLVIPGLTVKFTVLLGTPPTVTMTGAAPSPRLVGTLKPMLELPQLVGVTETPPTVRVLVPCVEPKFVPVMVTAMPTPPDEGERLAIPGVTLKLTLALENPPTVTMTGAAPSPSVGGTGTAMLPLLQLVGVTATPPTVTVLAPCVAPKLVPAIVIDVPTGPDAGVRLVMPGLTPKFTPGLEKPLTVTTTLVLPAARPLGTTTAMLPAFQLVVVATSPPMVTLLVP